MRLGHIYNPVTRGMPGEFCYASVGGGATVESRMGLSLRLEEGQEMSEDLKQAPEPWRAKRYCPAPEEAALIGA